MSKIIIDNRSKLPDETALDMVSIIIREGRVSNDGKDYCYASGFKSGHTVIARKNISSDTFIVLPPDETYINE